MFIRRKKMERLPEATPQVAAEDGNTITQIVDETEETQVGDEHDATAGASADEKAEAPECGEEKAEENENGGETSEEEQAEEPVPEPEEEPEDTEEAKAEPAPSVKEMLTEGFGAWAEGKNVSDLAKESIELAIGMIASAAEEGTVDEALYEILYKAADYDRAVAQAREEGEIRGRNARIDEILREEEEDDGVPHPGTGGGGAEPRIPSIFELARGAW